MPRSRNPRQAFEDYVAKFERGMTFYDQRLAHVAAKKQAAADEFRQQTAREAAFFMSLEEDLQALADHLERCIHGVSLVTSVYNDDTATAAAMKRALFRSAVATLKLARDYNDRLFAVQERMRTGIGVATDVAERYGKKKAKP